MKKKPLIGAAQEELKRTEFDPVRNAKLRVTSDANGRFRTIVEELLHAVNYGKITELEALKRMIYADATIKNDLMEAKESIEKQIDCAIEGSISEQRKYLIENYKSDDWRALNKEIFINILTKADSSSQSNSDSKSESEEIEEEQSDYSGKNRDRTENKAELAKRLAELDRLIGLSKVKEIIHQHTDLHVGYNKLLEKRGVPTASITLHMAFKGNPGTGKTTVAKLVAQIYKEMGVLSKGHLVCVERSDLVGQFIGHTEEKTKKVIKSALGGVLFIDEAYSLSVEDYATGKDFGTIAINTLITSLEEYRDDFIVIVAGYSNEMDRFLKSNPGLASRISTHVEFEDYSGEELYSICLYMLKNRNYTVSEKAEEIIRAFCQKLYENREETFGNGRDVRNFVDRLILQLSTRIMKTNDYESLETKELLTVRLEDVNNTVSQWYPSIGAILKEGNADR